MSVEQYVYYNGTVFADLEASEQEAAKRGELDLAFSADDWPEAGLSGMPAAMQNSISKMVIGPSDNDKSFDGVSMANATLPPGLMELFVWNGIGLAEMPALPRRLRVLELRNCPDLQEIGDLSLLKELEVLDLSGCAGISELPKTGHENLSQVYLKNCTGIEAKCFGYFLDDCPRIETVNLSGCTQLSGFALPAQPVEISQGEIDARAGRCVHPEFPEGRLRKLVLEGCANLRELPPLVNYPWLHHLNINGCESLECLPTLPLSLEPGFQKGLCYLVNSGCEKLQSFEGLDIRPVHLSQDKDHNVIDLFRAMQLLADPPTDLLSSKLMLLGSGRCGKTTLAKALQWKEFSETYRKEHPEMNPVNPSPSTHGIHFWTWPGSFIDAAQNAKVGTVHIWDFAGQDMYHNTHRMFAAQGSVFVIVTTERATHEKRLQKEMAEKGLVEGGEGTKRYQKENQYREVRYWLDYICNALGVKVDEAYRLPVVFVHSGEAPGDRDYITKQAGPYARWFEDGPFNVHGLDCSSVDFLASKSYKTLRAELGRKLWAAADQLAITVPGFFTAVHGVVEQLLAWQAAKPKDRKELPIHTTVQKHLSDLSTVCPSFSEWQEILQAELGGNYPPMAFDPAQLRGVTEHLHHIGKLFWLQQAVHSSEVLIDQKWGAEAVYALYDHAIGAGFRANHGVFTQEDLENQTDLRIQPFLKESNLLRRFLGLLEKCGVCAPMSGGRYQALLREMLAPQSVVKAEMRAQWYGVVTPEHICVSYRMMGGAGHMVGEADYQSVATWVAKMLPNNGLMDVLYRMTALKEETGIGYLRSEWTQRFRFWQHGLQVVIEPPTNQNQHHPAALRIEFRPNADDSFEGALYVYLLAVEPEEMRNRLQLNLDAEHGPLGTLQGCAEVSDRLDVNWDERTFGYLRDTPQSAWSDGAAPETVEKKHQVAISCRGSDLNLANVLRVALEAAGFHTYIYDDDIRLNFKPGDEESTIVEIYDQLANADCLVMIASQDYFDVSEVEPRKGNVYCPVELADGINAICEEKRLAAQTFWLARVSEDWNFGAIDDSVKSTIETIWNQVIVPRWPSDGANATIPEIDRRERQSVEHARGYLGLQDSPIVPGVVDLIGRNAKQVVRWDERKPETLDAAVGELVKKISGVLPGVSASSTELKS